MSNLLAMPLVQMQVETGTEEDWIDSIKFVVDTGVAVDLMPQLDIRGIDFYMEVRRSAASHEVVLAASTPDGSFLIGAPPDVGFLIFNIPLVELQKINPGDYVADVVGKDGFNTRVVVQIELTIVEGITKQPVNKRIVVEAA